MDKQLLDDTGNVVAEILDGDGDQQYLQIYPSSIFPYGATFDYSLVDGKPHAEFDTSQGGPRAKNGEPILRIAIDDRLADEDGEDWPDLPDWEAQEDPEVGVCYPWPRPKLLKQLWRVHGKARIEEVDRRLIVEFVRDEVNHTLDVLGFGSEFCGWDENETFTENVRVEEIVSAMLIELPAAP